MESCSIFDDLSDFSRKHLIPECSLWAVPNFFLFFLFIYEEFFQYRQNIKSNWLLDKCDHENNIWIVRATFICKFCISTLVEEAASGKAIKWRGFATDIDIECEMNPFHKIWRKEDNSDRLMNHRKGKKFNHAFCQTKHSWSVMNISMMSFIWSNLPSSSNHHLRKTLVLCRLTPKI